jgi:ABC-type transport system involved in multi-copper enzyme maturation permease subunit
MLISRVGTIATNVFREVLRERIIYLTVLFAGSLLLAISLLNEVAGGTENKITLDLGMAGIGLFGLVVAVFVGTNLISKEIEKRTVLMLIAKPISRTELIMGKHLGLSAVLTAMVFSLAIIFFVIMSARNFQYPAGSLLISVGFIALQLSLMAAVALCFGTFTSPLVATMLSFAVYIMGNFSSNLVVLSKTIKNPAVQHLVQGLYLVFPDLSRLDLKNDAVYGILPGTMTLVENAGYGVLYIVLLLSLSVFVFSRQEF